MVPTLNAAGTLAATLVSLLHQQARRVAVTVADSGSTDGTLALCAQHGIAPLYVPPGNMYAAVNAGLRATTGPWLAYVNADDWVYADTYDRLLSEAERTGADVVYGNCDYADEAGRFLYSSAAAEPRQLAPLFRRGVFGFAQPTAVFRRSVFDGVGGFSEALRQAADADFFRRALLSGARFARLGGAPLACFRLTSRQLSRTGEDLSKAEMAAQAGGATRRDAATEWRWRAANLPLHLLRVVRASLLARRLRLPRARELPA